MEISSIMVKTVKWVKPSDQAKKAVQIMNQNHIGCVAVIDNGILVGIITERDVLERLVIPCQIADKMTCKDIMTKDPVTIRPDQDVASAIDTMVKKKVKKLLVVEKGELVGIITATDILKSGKQIEDILISRMGQLFQFGEQPEEEEDYQYN